MSGVSLPVDPESVPEIITDTPRRRLVARLVMVIAAAMSLYHIYAIAFAPPQAQIFRSIHLLFAITLVFLIYPTRKSRGAGNPSLLDLALLAAAIAFNAYILVYFDYLIDRIPYIDDPTSIDLAMALTATLLTLEGTRRVIGLALPLTAVVFLAWCLLFTNITPSALLDQLYMAGYGGWQNCPPNIKGHLSKSYVLSQKIAQWYNPQRRCKVISLVRDPVALNVSGFFQNYRWWPAALIAQCKHKEPGYQHALLQHFLTSYAHDVPLTWFDLDLQPVFKIDVFATPFSVAAGYQTYQSDFADLLLLRLEDLNRCAAVAFPPFLGVDNFAIVRANEADAKWYATAYREFTQTVALPESYLDRIYNSKFAMHFYAEEELQAFRRKWQRTGT